MQQVIVFDLGGVVIPIFPDRMIRSLAETLNRGDDEVEAALHSIYDPFERGPRHLTREECFEKIKKALGIQNDIEESNFWRAFNDVWDHYRNPRMWAKPTLKKLSSRYPLFGCSNTNEEHYRHFEAVYPDIRSCFIKIVTSFEIEARKPERKMYEALIAMIERYGYDGRQIIFIDDDPRNVDKTALAGLGIEGIHHLSWARTRNILREKYKVEI